MMNAAASALEPYGVDKPLLIAVTVLTSLNQDDLNSVNVTKPLLEHVNDLAQLTKSSGLDGVVCSAYEAKVIKQRCGHDFITVTPGIRLPDNAGDDQSRIMTPKQAITEGSDYLVVGRPITRASNPLKSINDILSDLNATK
jgi:orotidine-5'-phosphate decarboxylase